MCITTLLLLLQPLQFANAMEIRFTSQDASTLTFDAGETGVQLGRLSNNLFPC